MICSVASSFHTAGVHFGYPNLGIGSCFVVSYSAALLLPIYGLESHRVGIHIFVRELFKMPSSDLVPVRKVASGSR